jgi:hypothetical protein
MFHYDAENNDHIPYQVEINMISSGFGSMSSKIHQLHHFLVSRFECLKTMFEGYSLEPSYSFDNIPKAIHAAHLLQGKGFYFLMV